MTYKNMLLGKMKYLILFLIAIQSVLLALMAIFFTGVQYEESWQSYNRNSGTVTVYLQKLSEEQSQSVYQYFLERSDLSIWTKRTTNSGKIILSRQQISDLLSHSDNNLTIGLDKGTDNMLYELPSLLFTTPVVINRLDHIFQETNTINGI